MNTDLIKNLAWKDATALAVRAMFEKFGYRQYYMGKFEPYDIYRENRNYLKSERIITFTDATGKLMALKPDVTMSIVRNTQKETKCRKLYYVENVFRMPPGSSEYREISQIGIEYIGGDGKYPEAEVAVLAMRTLELIGGKHVLSLGHMGFVSAVFKRCSLSGEGGERALEALQNKNPHEFKSAACQAGAQGAELELLMSLITTIGPVPEELEKLRTLALDEDMERALSDLEDVVSVLAAAGFTDGIQLDFSLTNDMDYYNGIVFQGFIEGLPRAVLSGGRYDRLMRRMGKPQPAIGFALYMGELSRAFSEVREYDADIQLVFGGAPSETVISAVIALTDEGKTVRAVESFSAKIRAKRVLRLTESGEMEEMK